MPSTHQNKALIDRIAQAVSTRRTLFDQAMTASSQTLRISHNDSPPLRIDKLGETLWMGWWADSAPTAHDVETIQFALLNLVPHKYWRLEWRPQREIQLKSKPVVFTSTPPPPDTWIAKENRYEFLFKSSSGFSPGLFLDQRDNRARIEKLSSENSSVLNLFCYTGGFSVASAYGSAQKIVSVDVSRPYLEWTRENLALNQFDPQSSRFEFWDFDVLEFLRMQNKKNKGSSLKLPLYQCIVIDPPSFGRSAKGNFRLEKDYIEMFELAKNLLTKNGLLMFTCNLEKWTLPVFKKLMLELAKTLKLQPVEWLRSSEDFEPLGAPTSTKGVIFKSLV